MMDVSKPIVSVIIPVYNSAKWLPQCLASVLSQSLKDIEVICVDDASEDDSKDVIKRIATQDKRVRLIETLHVSTGQVRNIGMDNAIGKYLAFMDSDDLYPDDGVLYDLVSGAEKNGCRIAGGYVLGFSQECMGSKTDATPNRAYYPNTVGVMEYRDFQCAMGFTAYVYERQMIVQNKISFPSITQFEDPPFFMEVMICAGQFYASNRCVYLYRHGHKSIHRWKRTKGYYMGLREKFSVVNGMIKKAVCCGLYNLARSLVVESFGSIELHQDFMEVKPFFRSILSIVKENRVLQDGDWAWLCRWVFRGEKSWKRLLFIIRELGIFKLRYLIIRGLS